MYNHYSSSSAPQTGDSLFTSLARSKLDHLAPNLNEVSTPALTLRKLSGFVTTLTV